MHTIQSLQQDLQQLGIKNSDTLLVHSSLKAIGAVDGGGEAVLDAMIGYLVPAGGLLVFPALTYHLNAENPEFSVADTPGIVGTLPELFRKRPESLRSWHPTHSVAAMGRDAAAFTAGHHDFDSPCARTSPWGRLADRRAKILFIGTGIGCNTFLHGVEEWFGVPDMLSRDPEMLYTNTPDGARLPVPCRRHQGHHSTWYYKTEPVLAASGALTTGRFGDASCHLVDAFGAMETVYGMLHQDPLIFTRD